MLLVIERERDIFVFGDKKKERKKERDAFSSVDRRDPPFIFYLFPLSVCNIILLDNQQSTPL